MLIFPRLYFPKLPFFLPRFPEPLFFLICVVSSTPFSVPCIFSPFFSTFVFSLFVISSEILKLLSFLLPYFRILITAFVPRFVVYITALYSSFSFSTLGRFSSVSFSPSYLINSDCVTSFSYGFILALSLFLPLSYSIFLRLSPLISLSLFSFTLSLPFPSLPLSLLLSLSLSLSLVIPPRPFPCPAADLLGRGHLSVGRPSRQWCGCRFAQQSHSCRPNPISRFSCVIPL